MAKVITEKTIRELAGRGERRLVLPRRAIVSALARDAAAELGIEIVEERGEGHDVPSGDVPAAAASDGPIGATPREGAAPEDGDDTGAIDNATVARTVAEVLQERLGTDVGEHAVREIVAQVLTDLSSTRAQSGESGRCSRDTCR